MWGGTESVFSRILMDLPVTESNPGHGAAGGQVIG